VLIKTDDILSGKYESAAHFVRFYDNDDLLLDEVAAFVDQALAAHGKGIVIASPAGAARCNCASTRWPTRRAAPLRRRNS
jgi:hypothetical protein